MDEENTYQALEIFEGDGDDEQWYWHVKSGNGNIVATGGEGYASKAGAYRGYAAASKVIVGLAGQHLAAQAEAEAKNLEQEAEAEAETTKGAGEAE